MTYPKFIKQRTKSLTRLINLLEKRKSSYMKNITTSNLYKKKDIWNEKLDWNIDEELAILQQKLWIHNL